MAGSIALPGLRARLDRLVYHRGGSSLPHDKPHAFVYFITIENHSDRRILLVGRKWVVEQEDGERQVIEGEKIVGETPRLEPGESFTYNSFHVTGGDARVVGSFHGTDDQGTPVHVVLDPFEMTIPRE
ncbi:MAG: Co2+/Mg2+ efflux protein ApaG [Synoicihabitans sp.]